MTLHSIRQYFPLTEKALPQHRNDYLNALESSGSKGTTELKDFLEINMARSMIFLLDKVGSEENTLLPLNEVRKTSGIDSSSKYIALRITQGEIPGIRLNKGWKTSLAAINFYREAKEKR